VSGNVGGNVGEENKPGPNDIVDLEVPNDWTKLFESRFLHAADLNGNRPILKVEKVLYEEMPDPKKPKQRKRMGSLRFDGKRKMLGLNRTNAACMKEMFGTDPRAWVGKRVSLYPTTVRMPKTGVFGVMVDEPCIRIDGSPDIAADIAFELRLPQRAAQTITLKKLPEPQKGAKP
jgi:hypothetical protein